MITLGFRRAKFYWIYGTLQINKYLSESGRNVRRERMTIEEVAMGFIKVANETMCRPIRALTQVLLMTALVRSLVFTQQWNCIRNAKMHCAKRLSTYISFYFYLDRRRVTTLHVTFWRVLGVPEGNTPVRSHDHWAFAQFSFINMPASYLLTVWHWRTLSKRHKSQVPRFTSKVVSSARQNLSLSFLHIACLYFHNILLKDS